MLIKEWKMRFLDYGVLDCNAPCSMYSVLLDNKLIEDPFYGLNELEYTKLSEHDCIFYSEVNLDRDILAKEFTELIFYGLDTLCDIYFNDVLLASVKNMHRKYVFDISKIAVKGSNIIKLHFKSPIKYFNKMNARHRIVNIRETLPGSGHLRKALYMAGWDWGPMLPDMGIFRDVEIIGYDCNKIENVLVSQQHYEDSVELSVDVETAHDGECEIFAEIDGNKVKLDNKKGRISIKNPKLWWPNGYGEQYIYELKVYARKNGELIDTVTKTIGLRTLTVSTEPDADGSEFCFVINGEKIFAMGANYIPQDSLCSRINRDTTQKLVDSCIDANFNCIRVWGGGYYPEDEFFEICDRAGLMVWQDYMVACMNVWLTEEMKEEFIAEATYNLKRIASHPSLAILCGNNEMEQGGWGFNELTKADYLELYEHILYEISYKYAPDTFYWPASPSSGGGFDKPTAENRGDVHYWAVWHGGIPFEEYHNHKFRFCSEYGFESFPNIKTIDSFCSVDEKNIFSRVMENHQKCKSGNSKILSYMSDKYLYPTNFDVLIYASQILQAEAIRLGVEHFRRLRGYCMGSIYWQLNDCWPVASWSSIDYFGRYKALHYEAKRFYAPLECGIFKEKGSIIVNVSNETLEKHCVSLKWRILRNDLSEIQCGEESIELKKLSSKDAYIIDISDLELDIYSDLFCVDMYDENGNFIMRRTELFTVPKYFEWKKPDIRVAAVDVPEGVEFSVTADSFARSVEIDFKNHDVVLSDNYFDITDNTEYKIYCKTELSANELLKDLTLKSVYDIR